MFRSDGWGEGGFARAQVRIHREFLVLILFLINSSLKYGGTQNLKDFNSTSFVNRLAYAWVYLTILVSLLCVAADTYTGISLLVFNRWSSQIRPIIPFEVAKFVFAGCILLSYLLYIVDWFFAIRIIRAGGVADAYMDSFALRWHVIRGGKGEEDTGWRRFLVFAKLTEKRGKRDYIALFTYFSFKGMNI